MNKKVIFSATLLASVFALAACGNGGSTESDSSASSEAANTEETSEYTIGVVGSAAHDVWDDVASRLEDEGIQLNIEEFSEYTTPNNALADGRSEEHTSELQSRFDLVCRLLLETKKADQ